MQKAHIKRVPSTEPSNLRDQRCQILHLESKLLLVTPYLRPFDDPAFGAVGEVVDFIQQTLKVSVCVWIWGVRAEHVLIRAYALCTAME